MARLLTANTQAEVAKRLGTEPLIIVSIAWESGERFYADKTRVGIEGKILTLGDISGEISETTYGEVGNTTIVLSDTDGSLKALFDSEIITKREVKIYNWYEGTLLSDKTLIFVGEISDDIVWSEGERTLSFTIDSKIKSEDVLLEVKETSDTFPNADDIGTVIPMCFGTCLRVPAVKLKRSIEGELLSPIWFYTTWFQPSGKISVGNGNFFVRNGESFSRGNIILEVDGTLFLGAFIGDTNQFQSTLGGFNWTYEQPTVNPRLVNDTDYDNPAVLWISSTDDITGKYLRMTLNVKYQYTKELVDGKITRHWVGDETDELSITDDNDNDVEIFTSNQYMEFVAQVNSQEENKIFLNKDCVDDFGRPFLIGEDGDVSIKFVAGKQDWRWKKLADINTPLRWDIPVGSEVTLYGGDSPLYVCNSVASTEILEVIGKRDDKFVSIPSSYYTKHLDYPAIVNPTENDPNPPTTEHLTAIEFDRSLVSRKEGWADQVFVSLRSSVAGATIPKCNTLETVIDWIITNKTNLTKDVTSFTAEGAKIENYPSHFALLNQIDALVAMRQISFQARCGLYIENNIVYAKYLSEEPLTYDYQADIDNIEMKSLNVMLENAVDISTKIKGLWNRSYDEEEARKITFFNNVSYYGVIEEDLEFYIYNIESLVQKSLDFWGNRYSNDWKYINIKTFLTSLAVQIWDKVELTIPYINNGSPVIGWVKKISHDSAEHDISLGIWLPLTLGDGEPYLDDSLDTMPTDPGEGLGELDYKVNAEPILRTRMTPDFKDKGLTVSEDANSLDEERNTQLQNALRIMDMKERYFKVYKVENNLLFGELLNDSDLTKDGKVKNDPKHVVKTLVPIAKVLELREKTWNNNVIDGVTYSKINETDRRASGTIDIDGVPTTVNRLERINPPYSYEDGTPVIIKAQYCPKGTGVWSEAPVVWQEVSARAWTDVEEITK